MPQRRIGWHPEDIRAALRKKHGTLIAFAKAEEFSLSGIVRAVNGKVFVPGPCRAISASLDVSSYELWPQWFHPDGTAKSGRGAANRRGDRQHQLSCTNKNHGRPAQTGKAA